MVAVSCWLRTAYQRTASTKRRQGPTEHWRFTTTKTAKQSPAVSRWRHRAVTWPSRCAAATWPLTGNWNSSINSSSTGRHSAWLNAAASNYLLLRAFSVVAETRPSSLHHPPPHLSYVLSSLCFSSHWHPLRAVNSEDVIAHCTYYTMHLFFPSDSSIHRPIFVYFGGHVCWIQLTTSTAFQFALNSLIVSYRIVLLYSNLFDKTCRLKSYNL